MKKNPDDKKKRGRSAPTIRPANKKIRQFKFEVRDVKLVTDHLKEHGNIKKGDLEIPWVDTFPPQGLKTNSQLKLPPGPHNRTRLMGRETPNGRFSDCNFRKEHTFFRISEYTRKIYMKTVEKNWLCENL